MNKINSGDNEIEVEVLRESEFKEVFADRINPSTFASNNFESVLDVEKAFDKLG